MVKRVACLGYSFERHIATEETIVVLDSECRIDVKNDSHPSAKWNAGTKQLNEGKA